MINLKRDYEVKVFYGKLNLNFKFLLYIISICKFPIFILNVERDSNTNEQVDFDEIGKLSPNTKLERAMSQPLMIIPSPIHIGNQ